MFKTPSPEERQCASVIARTAGVTEQAHYGLTELNQIPKKNEHIELFRTNTTDVDDSKSFLVPWRTAEDLDGMGESDYDSPEDNGVLQQNRYRRYCRIDR